MASSSSPHPLDPLSVAEVRKAAHIIQNHIQAKGGQVRIKVIDLAEPPKDLVLSHLYHKGPEPPRKVRIYFHRTDSHSLFSGIINLSSAQVETIEELADVQGPVDWTEYELVTNACNSHPAVLAEVAKLKLPKTARVLNDPWAYGTDNSTETRRLFQCYLYAALNDDPQANHYSTPLPLAPIFDAHTLELVDLQRLPMGIDGQLDEEVRPWEPTKPVEYSADLVGPDAIRKDLKPLQVVQPEGPSFTISGSGGRTVSWQKWKFQLGWNMREGPVLHDVSFDGRPLFYRVSMSEMTVPYGDPRTPYHRKQAFDLGDSGFGLTSNSLELGCDCLGHIAYFDGVRVTMEGEPVLMRNVVCMHEIDDGIGWKHTNFRNGAASAVRSRQLVVQCTATVANYEYILAFILDQAAALHVEVRATGIVSTMPIRSSSSSSTEPPSSDWGTVVAPGVLAVNHQHLFCVRVDPNLDGCNRNAVVYEDCVPVTTASSSSTSGSDYDPAGCAFRVQTTPVTKPGGYDLDLTRNRTYKIISSSSSFSSSSNNDKNKNSVSGKDRAYKLHAAPSQMLMMNPSTYHFRRGIFATRPIWVTGYRDGELWAAGEFTNQSREDTGIAVYSGEKGERLAAAEGGEGEVGKGKGAVLWHTFGITHVTRPEDFPVMPVEKMTMSLKPSNFFEQNPSNDVPRSTQSFNQSTLHSDQQKGGKCCL